MTSEIQAMICDMIVKGESLTSICSMPDFPSMGAVYLNRRWFPEFDDRIRDAYRIRAEMFHDLAITTAMEVTNKEDVPAAKLKVDTLKWAAEKGDRSRFGSTEQVSGQQGGIQIIIDTGINKHIGADIQVNMNEQGEFIGFGGSDEDSTIVRGSGGSDSSCEPIELSKDRWKEIGGS
jgi:hypothetical protein